MDRSHHPSALSPELSIIMYQTGARDGWHLCLVEPMTAADALLYVDRESEQHPGLMFQAFRLVPIDTLPRLTGAATDVYRRCPNCSELVWHDIENGAARGYSSDQSWRHLVSGRWACEDVDTFSLPMTAGVA